MAHVLLPCELPFWPDVREQLSVLRRARDIRQAVDVLRAIYRICSVAVEQVDEDRASEDEMRFDLCEAFLEDFDDTKLLLDTIFPTVIDLARRIDDCRPRNFVYSLQAEEGSWCLSREFVASLLAHSVLSSFPLRTLRSHPTLQDFNRCTTFRYLTLDQHKQAFTNLLQYFKEVRGQLDGYITVSRRILVRCPPLTEWVCSPLPLCPLTVRHAASLDDAEAHLYRVVPVNSQLSVFKNLECAENEFLLQHPELLVLQLFCEALRENEVLVVEGLRRLRVQSTAARDIDRLRNSVSSRMSASHAAGSVASSSVRRGHRATPLGSEEFQLNSNDQVKRVGLLDALSLEKEFLYRQYLDESLLFNLNKCLNAFHQATRDGSRKSVNLSAQPDSEQAKHHTQTASRSGCFEEEVAALATTLTSVDLEMADPKQPLMRYLRPNVSHGLTQTGSDALHLFSCQKIGENLLQDNSTTNFSSLVALQKPPCGMREAGQQCNAPENEISAKVDKSSPKKTPQLPTRVPVARHLVTENFLQTQALLDSPKHPSPRPRKRTVSGSTGTYQDDSEATLLSRPVGQPLLLTRPAPGQPLGATTNASGLPKGFSNIHFTTEAQVIFPAPPVSSTVFAPSSQSEDSSGSFRADSRELNLASSKPSVRGTTMSSTEKQYSDYRGDAVDTTGCLTDSIKESACEKLCASKLHRSLSKTSRASSFRTAFSRRCSKQLSTEDDYFTAEESVDVDEDSDDCSGDQDMSVSRTSGLGMVPPHMIGSVCRGGGSCCQKHTRRYWKNSRSRSSRTFDSEFSLRSSLDENFQDQLGQERGLLREDSVGSAGFVLDRRTGPGNLSESDVASSAGRLFYRERQRRQRDGALLATMGAAAAATGSVDSTSASNNGARRSAVNGASAGRRLARLRATQSSKSRSFTQRSFEWKQSSDCSSCYGSSMEDILEDPELLSPLLDPLHPLCSPLLFRRANSEPSLPSCALYSFSNSVCTHGRLNAGLSECRVKGSVFSILVHGKAVPKAYSFDGVSPNLPVPFKAKFRIRKKRSPSAEADAVRHALTKEDLDYIKRVVREENRQQSVTESQDSSRAQEMQKNSEQNQKISPSLAEGPGGMLPVACTKWTKGVESEFDAQLEALLLWLAASAACLPHLVIYTHGESRLQHLGDVQAKAVERGWSCGDLAGELVRFSRNKMSIHRGVGRVSTELSLFMQILQPSKPPP